MMIAAIPDATFPACVAVNAAGFLDPRKGGVITPADFAAGDFNSSDFSTGT